MGSKGGLSGRAGALGREGWGTVERAPDCFCRPQLWGNVSSWSQIPQKCRLGLRGCGGT